MKRPGLTGSGNHWNLCSENNLPSQMGGGSIYSISQTRDNKWNRRGTHEFYISVTTISAQLLPVL